MGLFSIIARLTMDTAGFNAGARKAESRATQMAGKIGATIKGQLAAAFGFAAIAAATRSVVNYADKISDMSVQLRVSVKELQEFDYVAAQAGLSLDDLASSLGRLGKARADALGGRNKEAMDVFQNAFGLGSEQLAEMSTKDILHRISRVVKTTDFGNDEGAIMQMLFGRSGERLIPMLKGDMEGLTEEANRLGAVMEDGVVKSLDTIADNFTKLTKIVRGPLGSAVAWLSGMLVDAAKAMQLLISTPLAFLGGAAGQGKGNDASFGGILKSIRAQLSAGGGAVADLWKDAFREMAMPEDEEMPDGSFARSRSDFSFARSAAAAGVGSSGRVNTLGQGSLAAIGGFVGLGGTRDVQVEVMKKQLNVLKEIERNTEQREGEDEL